MVETQTPAAATGTITATDHKEAELAIKYVLDKGENGYEGGIGGNSPVHGCFTPSKNTAKLPVSFLKMKMQQKLRKE